MSTPTTPRKPRARTGEVLPVADDETRTFILGQLDARVETRAAELLHVAREDPASRGDLIDAARRLVTATDAWLHATGGEGGGGS